MTVYLVGAGPGDPELLTRKAAKILAIADVVIVDRLVDPRLLDESREDAVIIDVSKHPRDGSKSTEQSRINELLVHYGKTVDVVVRLKGGDPFVFGRGGEEVAALDAAGIDVEVVPGVSSAFSVPALAGIPVTHRGVATAVTVISGHDVSSEFAWERYGALPGTLVLLMAVAHRSTIAKRLIKGGRDAQTPVAVIEWGSTKRERRTLSSLDQLGDLDVEAPSVIVIGDVALQMRSSNSAQ